MNRPVASLAVSLALFVPAAACAPSHPGAGSSRPLERDTIVVEVNNLHFLDATVWIRYEASALQRLGLVTGQSRDTFVVRHQAQRFIFTIDLVGSGEFITDPPIVARPGDALELRLPSNLDRGAGGFRRVRE